MLIKFDKHPAPGYYENEGRMITTETSGPGKVVRSGDQQRSITVANLGMGGGGSGGYGGGYSGTGGGGSGYGGMGGGGSASTTDKYNPIRDRLEDGSVVEDGIPRDAAGLDQLFSLMYHRDHIAGTIVDIIAETIWSDYDLHGIKDPAIKKIFEESMEAIDPVDTCPGLTREFCVQGRSISSLIFDKERGIFVDLASHDPSFVQLTPRQIKGLDPKIDLIPTPGLRAFIQSQDPRDVEAREMLPAAFIEAVSKAGGGASGYSNSYSAAGGGGGFGSRGGGTGGGISGGIPLDPLNTLFLPRRVFSYDYIGTSLYTRLLNFWAVEKALINSTVTSARRRARSILHVSAGIDNVWQPTPPELEALGGLFTSADEDPVGAVVVTRTGVNTNEVRQGGDFYKWSDEWSLLNEGKLRALGANDALLTGDATYSNQETARAFFMEKLVSLRNSLTQRIFTKKIFPLLARVHGFRKTSQAELDNKVRLREALSIPDNDLIVPTIRWRKELINDVDEKRLEILAKAEEVGFPVTLSAWASAMNIDLDAFIADLDGDADLRKRINLWRDSYQDASVLAEQEAKLEFVNSLKSLAKVEAQKVLSSSEHNAEEIGPVASYVFWGDRHQIAGVSLKDMAEVLADFKRDDNSLKALFDSSHLPKRLLSHFRSSDRAQVAHFLLYRTGLTPIQPLLSNEVVAAISEGVSSSLDKWVSHAKVHQLSKLAQLELAVVSKLSVAARRAKERSFSRLDKIVKVNEPISSKATNLYSGREY
jgi:hypothetical protein